MPIKPENKNKYPANWKQISKDIRLNRAANRCECCGVENYALIFRCRYDGVECYQTIDGHLFNADNSELMARDTEHWNLYPTNRSHDRAIKVILTVAHLDHDPTNNDYNNLKAMCQRCHNRYDIEHRKGTRRKKTEGKSLFDVS
jgi:hypothetical protein